MQAFQAAFVPSKLRRAAVCLFAAVLAACLWHGFDGIRRILLLAAAAAAALWGWRNETQPVTLLSVDSFGRAVLTRGGTETAATLLPGSLISPLLCCLKWQTADGVFRQCILPDMTGRESWRRLTVWANFGRPKPEKKYSESK